MALAIGCLHVRRCVFINATPSRVWQEFVDFEHLNRWFGRGHTLESFQPRVGAEVRLSIENGTRAFGGSLLVFDPERGSVSRTTGTAPMRGQFRRLSHFDYKAATAALLSSSSIMDSNGLETLRPTILKGTKQAGRSITCRLCGGSSKVNRPARLRLIEWRGAGCDPPR